MRAGRLVELLGLLQARGRMTATQLARELEVSPRTIIRDIEELSAAGFGVYAIRGSSGGFELLPGAGLEPATSTAHLRAAGPGARGRARIRLSAHGRQLAALSGRPAGLRVRRPVRASRAEPGQAARPGWVEAWLPVGSLADAAAGILALGAEAEVIEPGGLRDLVRETALRIADLNRST
jgi:predicted DNA-binding transcriptional regulator YafY